MRFKIAHDHHLLTSYSVGITADWNCASYRNESGIVKQELLHLHHIVKSRYNWRKSLDGSDISLILVIYTMKAIIHWNTFVVVLKQILRFQFWSELCSKINILKKKTFKIAITIRFRSFPSTVLLILKKNTSFFLARTPPPQPSTLSQFVNLEPSVKRREIWVQI